MLSDSKNNKPPRPFFLAGAEEQRAPPLLRLGGYRDLSSAPQHGWLNVTESTDEEDRGRDQFPKAGLVNVFSSSIAKTLEQSTYTCYSLVGVISSEL